jgi:arsenite methyltransferase
MNASVHPAPSATRPVDVDRDGLRRAIQQEYTIVAEEPDRGFHFHTGRPLARILGYDDAWLEGIPEPTIASFAGTGSPFRLGAIRPGEHVVDVGSGGGIDSLIASKMVGAEGRVIGVDMTPAMLAKARASAAVMGATNAEFREGYAESLPVDDGWADVVISNGVMNLFPDKPAVLREMARVLRPGGRLQIADILVDRPVPVGARCNIDLWTGCIAGAVMEPDLQAMVTDAGFVDFEITWRADVFGGAPQASSAAQFGTVGINFRARKPA